MQGAALALGAGSVERGLLRFGQQCADVWGGGVEMDPAQAEGLAAVAVGEQSKVADLDEACRQDMEQEAADELDRVEVHNGAAVVAFGCDVDYAMLIKLYGNDSFDTKYSPGECIGTQSAVMMGDPGSTHISTSFVARQNLTMCMSMRRFTRLTNGFSKKLENHVHQVALYFMHYNFCRIHKTLRVTPAMEAGLIDHVWTLEELCGLIPEKKPIQRIDAAIISKALRTA